MRRESPAFRHGECQSIPSELYAANSGKTPYAYAYQAGLELSEIEKSRWESVKKRLSAALSSSVDESFWPKTKDKRTLRRLAMLNKRGGYKLTKSRLRKKRDKAQTAIYKIQESPCL